MSILFFLSSIVCSRQCFPLTFFPVVKDILLILLLLFLIFLVHIMVFVLDNVSHSCLCLILSLNFCHWYFQCYFSLMPLLVFTYGVESHVLPLIHWYIFIMKLIITDAFSSYCLLMLIIPPMILLSFHESCFWSMLIVKKLTSRFWCFNLWWVIMLLLFWCHWLLFLVLLMILMLASLD